MSTCIECKHFIPLYSNTEFATARLLNTSITIQMRCHTGVNPEHTYTMSINYIITPHPISCDRYEIM